jgi:tRNA pseudouridine13 synthase
MEENTDKKRKLEDVQVEDGNASKKLKDEKDTTMEATSSSTDLSAVELQLSSLVGEEHASGAVQMLKKWEDVKASPPNDSQPFPKKGVDDEEKYFTFPLVEDKETRKSIHMLIKSDALSHISLADTVDKKVRIWHRAFERHMPNYGKFESGRNNGNRGGKGKKERPVWPANRPNYLRFVLYKENCDTGTAAKDISRMARLPPKGRGGGGMGYAGMKDKRGVTSQFCTVFKRTPRDLMFLNKSRDDRNLHGGGNSRRAGFSVLKVGHFSYVDNELRLGQLTGNRFDVVLRNVCTNAKATSKAEQIVLSTQCLKNAAKSMTEIGFINYFGMQRFGKFYDTHKVGIAVLNGKFEEACDIIMRVKENEGERYVDVRSRWANRFDKINREDDSSVRNAEMQCAKSIIRDLGRFMNCETSIVVSLSRKPCDYKKAFTSIAKGMRSMFLHAYQSYLWNRAASHRIAEGGSTSVTIGDLVLIEDKSLTEGGNGTSGLKGKAVRVVTQEDVDEDKFSIEDVVLPLVGFKIEYPTNSTGKLFDDMLLEDGLSKQHFKKMNDRELSLGGDYRKIICKPGGVDFEIKKYKDPEQPLLQTDLMAVHDVPLECVDVTHETKKEETTSDVKEEGEDKETILGMVIRFTLPPSAYATIALRELMKRPTSADYQRELQLVGDCEAKVGKK